MHNQTHNEHFEWLHLSDFHIDGDRGPQREALDLQLTKIVDIAKEIEKIDAVFLVGDIAYKGDQNSYAVFTSQFLVPLKSIPALRNAEIIVVPGNHDVDCDAAIPISWDTIHKRRDYFFSEDEQGIRIRSHRAATFSAYNDFIKVNNLISPDPFNNVSILKSISGAPFDVVATNTSFFSDREEDSSKPTTPFPLQSLRHLIGTRKFGRPFLVLGHHSMTSLRNEHAKQFITFLQQNHAVYFHGHDHEVKPSFNADGTIRTLGLGASFIKAPGDQGDPVYKNSFAHCILTDRLFINSYSWDPFPGKWINTTESQLSDCTIEAGPRGQKYAVVKFPMLDLQGDNSGRPVPVATIPRVSAKPISFIPTGELNIKAWEHVLIASANLGPHISKNSARISQLPDEPGKTCLSIDSGDTRHLLICISAVSHILSYKELEAFNTRLDMEDFETLTVVSLGKMANDARTMYARLRSRKQIEVMTNSDLANCAGVILSAPQKSHLSSLDAAEHEVHMLVGEEDVFLLVKVTTERDRSFYILDSKGAVVNEADPLVAFLRGSGGGFEVLPYTGGFHSQHQTKKFDTKFDEQLYLDSCFNLYNNIKYAALANVGIRFEDLPLDELYVAAKASEVEGASASRLEELVGDHLERFSVSDALREHIKKQLLTPLESGEGREASYARGFYQKYGLILVVGDPGSGKTCFTKSELLAYCEQKGQGDEGVNWYQDHLPIMVQLSELVAESDLEENGIAKIASRLLARRALSLPEEVIESYSKKGRIAWFFDGLDEVVSIEKRALVVQQINDLVTESLTVGNRVIVTSRPAAIQVVNLLPQLHKLEIQGFSGPEIRMLAERILQLKLVSTDEGVVIDEAASRKRHPNLVDQLLQDCERNAGVNRLAQNPLMLTLLIMIYANAGAPSAKRHLIYAQAVDTLAFVRGREAGHQPISAQDLKERLGAVALSVYKKQSGLLPSRREVREIIRAVMQRQRGEDVSSAEADAFIQKAAESTGLIAVEQKIGVGDDNAIVTFMHHSFLEYFAAVGLSREANEGNIETLVTQPRWHEILTLLSGIIGETEDVAPVLGKFINAATNYNDVSAKMLTFAMDCASECDVPSEAALRLLARAIRSNVESGPARLDPWVRSEIGRRIGTIMSVCGNGEFESALLPLLNHPDGETCAAAIDLVGYILEVECLSSTLVKAIEGVCTRTEESVLCAICSAVGRSPHLRSVMLLQVLERCLGKAKRCQVAAMDALTKIPTVAVRHWREIIEAIDSKDRSLARAASKVAVGAGLNADVVSLTGDRKHVLLRALKHSENMEDDISLGKVSLKSIDRLWSSAYERDRLLSIELLPLSDASEAESYERLMLLLAAQADREETVAALHAFRESRAKDLIKQTDLRTIAEWMKEGSSDVRIAAVRLLSCFGAETVAVEALLSRNLETLGVAEYAAVVYALGNATVLTEPSGKLLFDEVRRLAVKSRRTGEDSERRLTALFAALRRRKEKAPRDVSECIKEFFDDYRIKPELRGAAIACLPAVLQPTPNNVKYFERLFTKRVSGIDATLVQLPSDVAEMTKESVDAVMKCVDSLTQLREVVQEYYAQVTRSRASDNTGLFVTQLRAGLEDLSEIIVTFNEFIGQQASQNPAP